MTLKRVLTSLVAFQAFTEDVFIFSLLVYIAY